MPKIFSVMLANRETRLIAADSWESAIHAVGIVYGSDSLLSAAFVGNLDLDAEDLTTDEGETLQ